jgi:4-aminobutyrate aminotransferase / (S)-3-amino-2-methylpropionate transaminase / 5-aminovalerate transaminase
LFLWDDGGQWWGKMTSLVRMRRRDDVQAAISEAELLALEAEYCSHGDTVHYTDPPKIFESCDGSFLYDSEGREYLDLQMWYSAVNFGYRNRRLNDAVKRQLDRLPQVASQYLHREKIELAAILARDAQKKFGIKGRIHFNVGGSQAIEDSLKLVRNYKHGKSLMFAFEGGYHGRTLGASAITSSYRYRRRFGHFGDRAQFLPFPYHFRGPKGMSKEEYGLHCVQHFERLFESEYNGVWDPRAGEAEYAAFYVEPIQGTGGYVIPPKTFFVELKKVLDRHGILLIVDEIQMGFYRTGKLWSIEHFGVQPDAIVFGKSITNGLNPLAGVWAREELINPTVFPTGSTHSTFNANPMGTAVALEAMKMMAETDYETMVTEKGAYFLEGLKDLQRRHAIVGDVDGLGLALRMEICEPHDSFTPSKAIVDCMVLEALKGDLAVEGKTYGLVLDIGGYYKNVITLAPSLHISKDEMDLALQLLDVLMHRVMKGTA